MIFKTLIILVYAGFTAFSLYRVIRERCIVKGNVSIILLLPALFALFYPGDETTCFARVCFNSTPLIFAISLIILGKGVGISEVFKLYLALPLTILLEFAALRMEMDNLALSGSYTLLYLLSILIFTIWLAYCKRSCKEVNNMLSVGRLYDVFVWVSLVMLLSGGVMLLLNFVHCKWVPQGAMAIFLALQLYCVFKISPQCFGKRSSEYLKVRKRAYVLGKSVRDGQILQDDEFGIVNDGVIDDVRIISNLIELFEREKLYRNVDVKIANVAIMLGTNKTYLSRALNTRVGKNFCQFVNYYRVREICQLYLEDTSRDIRRISETCGFSSPSNFSIVFKYSTGFTPGDWCRVVKSKIEANEQVSVDDFVV